MSRIGDHALIGDGRSAALVSLDGDVDWLCWPRFDSPSLFAAILDGERGGRWRIAPRGPFRARRAYARESNVLVTTFETATGAITLTDLMPLGGEVSAEHELLRVAEGTRGRVELEVIFDPRPDYGRKVVRPRDAGPFGLRVEDGRHLYTLRGPVGVVTVVAGERVSWSLTYDREAPAVFPPMSPDAVARTNAWWRDFAARCAYDGPYRDAVVRSALALKLLGHAPSGAIIAAPTTSLPERIGGDLNWDYRYCWARDAALTVRALLCLGYEGDAEAFASWLLHTTRLTRARLRVLYDVYGRVPSREVILDHLRGHRGSRPVRVGNAAAAQLQLDVYGEVIDAVAQIVRRGGGPRVKIDPDTRKMLRDFRDFVTRSWRLPDQGIWEPRGGARHHTHSRLLCWTALDRLAELGLADAAALAARAELRDQLERRAWNPRLESYVDELDGDRVDASLLLMAWHGFEDARSPRMRATWRRIRERLEVAPGRFLRNEESRDLGEGAFGICSFWAVEFLARGGGSLDEAEDAFVALLHHMNDVGLYAEEFDLATGEPLGNFPQAFTHVGLISAALAIEERRREVAPRCPARPAAHDEEARP